MLECLKSTLRRGVNPTDLAEQIIRIGLNSVPLVIVTALSTGMVLALQTAYGLERFGAKNYVGNITGLGFLRELGPVLTAIVIAGRVGAGVTAEIASMVVTEQVDAMISFGSSPQQKLISPRLIAAFVSAPLLVVTADVIGLFGGYLVAVFELGISGHLYLSSLGNTVVMRDFTDGLIKSSIFGLLVVGIACFYGLYTGVGTKGVGVATRSSVVTSIIVVFLADFLLTKLLLLI